MNKTAIGLSLILALLLSYGTLFIGLTGANPQWANINVPKEPFNNPPTIQTLSPVQNQILTSSNVLLSFCVTIPNSWIFSIDLYNPPHLLTFGNITLVRYSLDDNQPQNLTVDPLNVPHSSNRSQDLNFSVPMNLSEGTHTIKIFVSGFTYYVSDPYQYNPPLASVPVQAFAKVSFNVVLPTPIIISPNEIVYNESAVPLEFTLGSAPSWIGYSLDRNVNTTIGGNTTLTGLSNGEHNITIYTKDYLGNSYASQPANFIVTLPTESAPFPTVLVAAVSIAAVVVVAAGLVVYFKIRKH